MATATLNQNAMAIDRKELAAYQARKQASQPANPFYTGMIDFVEAMLTEMGGSPLGNAGNVIAHDQRIVDNKFLRAAFAVGMIKADVEYCGRRALQRYEPR
jgi:hypothetical protein